MSSPRRASIPRLGYFAGIALAVSAGLIDPPIGVFIAAIPFIKMLDLPCLRIVTPHGASDEPVEGSS